MEEERTIPPRSVADFKMAASGAKKAASGGKKLMGQGGVKVGMAKVVANLPKDGMALARSVLVEKGVEKGVASRQPAAPLQAAAARIFCGQLRAPACGAHQPAANISRPRQRRAWGVPIMKKNPVYHFSLLGILLLMIPP